MLFEKAGAFFERLDDPRRWLRLVRGAAARGPWARRLDQDRTRVPLRLLPRLHQLLHRGKPTLLVRSTAVVVHVALVGLGGVLLGEQASRERLGVHLGAVARQAHGAQQREPPQHGSERGAPTLGNKSAVGRRARATCAHRGTSKVSLDRSSDG